MSQDTKECYGDYEDTQKPPEQSTAFCISWLNKSGELLHAHVYFVCFSLSAYFHETSPLQ